MMVSMEAVTTEVVPSRTAVRDGADAGDEAALASFHAATDERDVVRFAHKDTADLNDALCAGGFERVVFARLDDLLTVIWNGDAELHRWESAGVRIEVAAPPAADPDGWRAVLDETYDSYARWQRNHKRNQICAACILSLLALAALAVLFLLIPRP